MKLRVLYVVHLRYKWVKETDKLQYLVRWYYQLTSSDNVMHFKKKRNHKIASYEWVLSKIEFYLRNCINTSFLIVTIVIVVVIIVIVRSPVYLIYMCDDRLLASYWRDELFNCKGISNEWHFKKLLYIY